MTLRGSMGEDVGGEVEGEDEVDLEDEVVVAVGGEAREVVLIKGETSFLVEGGWVEEN